MLKNYFKIAFRQIKKQKFYSAVNIIGLAIGVTCCLLITLFIQDELSYDQQHPNNENLYRIVRDMHLADGSAKVTVCPSILAPTLIEEIPEIENAVRLNPYTFNAGSNLVRKKDNKENQFEDGFTYADPSALELFHLPLIHGDKTNALTQPFSIIISKKVAKKYFQNQNPIGEVFILNDNPEQTYTITGVMENIRKQNHFQYDFLMSMSTVRDSYENPTWLSNNYYTYVSLVAGTKPEDLDSKFHDFIIKNMGPQFKEQLNMDLASLENDGLHYKYFLQPVTDIHLKSEGSFPQLQPLGDDRYVWLFGAIALFILLIALVNFVNLSTSRSANRAKEVGLRKVLGSFQKQLVKQFLIESILMSLFAFVLGTLFATLLISPFNLFLEKELSIPFTELSFVASILGSALVAGVLAGLYPAFYLSGFQPVKVLKGKLSMGSKSGWLRSGLVVVQFAISIGLIVGTIVVNKQMDFIQNKKLGFEKDQVLLIQDTYTLGDQLPSFKNELKKLPEVINATATGYLPFDGGSRNSNTFFPKGTEAPEDQVQLQCWNIDEDYIKTLGMNLKLGRNFKREMTMDSSSVILNETATRMFNLGDDPIGKIIKSPFAAGVDFTVVGVVEDFHWESLKGKVESLGFFWGNSTGIVSVKSSAIAMDNLIEKTESVWKKFAPTQPFRYEFLDDRFARMYTSEGRVNVLFSVFSLLAIFIASLGLLALATFMTEQRMKEIGIRKILGASVSNIVFQLSKNFLLYVVIGLLIAAPIAYLQMNEWLNNFEYRIEITWWMIVLAGSLAIGIAFLTVGSKTLVAALSNPVESLRNE